ncbi:hypothetical protein RJ639_015248 [Escallonia herrerae]|uniref:Regulatory protein RecX n=1 Tax=Escallonia herrerae TaxID=1293975 RepID=A0AA89ALM0_9ASTE|nr:hypothetical protein RJ639_015248 [Escallonia herrerae]
MAIFAVKFIVGTALKLQCRTVLAPWLNKNNFVKCSKDRDYSSSYPVRYIPKNPVKNKEKRILSPALKGSEDKEIRNTLGHNFVSAEVSNGGKGSRESIASVDKSQNKFQNQRSDRSLSLNVEPEAENWIDDKSKIQDHDVVEEPEEDARELEIHQKDAGKTKKVAKKMAAEMLATRLENKEIRIPSLPMKDFEDKEMHDTTGPNLVRAEVSNGGKSSPKSFVLDNKSISRFRNHISSNFLVPSDEPEVENEIHHKDGIEDYEFMEEPEEDVHEVQIHQNDVGGTKQETEKMAVELLAKRAYTAVELKKKLLGKRCVQNIVDAVIIDFQSRGLINDYLYAETYSRSRWSSSSWGPRRIKQSLYKKGVTKVDSEKAIKLVFQDGESGGDQESRLGLSKLSMDHLLVQASKQWQRGRDVPSDKRKSRIIRWLQYRGFDWRVVSFVLKKLESQNLP